MAVRLLKFLSLSFHGNSDVEPLPPVPIWGWTVPPIAMSVPSSNKVYALQMDEGAFQSATGDIPPFRAYMRPHTTTTATKLLIEIANQPDEPENPDQPDTPDQPDQPDTPDQPVIPDAIEGMDEGALFYPANGAIVIAPTEPIEAWIVASTGHTIYHAKIADRTQMNVNTGIYMLSIKKGNEIIKEKLIVRWYYWRRADNTNPSPQ